MSRPTSARLRLARYGFTDVVAAAKLLGPAPDGLGLWDDAELAPTDAAAGDVLTALGSSADPYLAAAPAAPSRGGGSSDRAGRRSAGRDAVRRRRTVGAGRGARCLDHARGRPGRRPDPVARGARPRLATRRPVPRCRGGLAGPAALGLPYRPAPPRRGRPHRPPVRRGAATMRPASVPARRRDDGGGAATGRGERGATPRLAVIAMGKCGGRELNYVSDVDVIFVCDSDADLADAQVIAARMMQICGQAAWQVDANLRPEGSQGPLVRTLASHLAYYQRWARTWEFQALLKARPAAGDLVARGSAGSSRYSRWSGTRLSGPRRSRTCARCGGASSRTSRRPSVSVRSSSARVDCATSSSRCS